MSKRRASRSVEGKTRFKVQIYSWKLEETVSEMEIYANTVYATDREQAIRKVGMQAVQKAKRSTE